MVTIHIEADPEIIRHRLESRGRESFGDIEKRLSHAPAIDGDHHTVISIRNDGLLEEGGKALINAIDAFG